MLLNRVLPLSLPYLLGPSCRHKRECVCVNAPLCTKCMVPLHISTLPTIPTPPPLHSSPLHSSPLHSSPSLPYSSTPPPPLLPPPLLPPPLLTFTSLLLAPPLHTPPSLTCSYKSNSCVPCVGKTFPLGYPSLCHPACVYQTPVPCKPHPLHRHC